MKLPLLQYDAPEIKKFNKRRLLTALILLLVLIVPAGSIISKGVFNRDSGGQTEAALEGQSKEAEKTGAGTDGAAGAAAAGGLENRLASDFIKILQSGNYTIRYKTTTVYEGKPYEIETTYAVSGSSIAMASSDRATVVRDDKVFMMNHTDRTIISWDVGDKDNNLRRIGVQGMVYIESMEENGLVCEEYESSSARFKLYFKGKEPVKMRMSAKGQDMDIDIIEVEEEASADIFEVPPGYLTTYLTSGAGTGGGADTW